MLMDLYIALWSPVPVGVIADMAEEEGANPSLIAVFRINPTVLACDLAFSTSTPCPPRYSDDDTVFAMWRLRVWCEQRGCKLSSGVEDDEGVIRGPGYIIV